MRDIVSAISDNAIGDEILALWTEYEDRNTRESHVAYQLDKFEMIYQVSNSTHLIVPPSNIIVDTGR